LVHSSKLISDNELLVAKLAGIGRFEHGQNGGLALSSLDHVWLDLDAATVRRYVDDLKTQLKDKDVYLKRLKKQLNNAAFTKSAPTKIIQDTRDRYDEALMLRSKLNEQIRQIQSV
jgi:valyl-tRNA synthetase